jgi:hypothetical protein
MLVWYPEDSACSSCDRIGIKVRNMKMYVPEGIVENFDRIKAIFEETDIGKPDDNLQILF